MNSALRQPTPSCASTFVRLIVNVIAEQGIDRLALCRRAGLDPALLEDNDARIAQPQVNLLWQLAVETSGDATIGLQVAQRIGPEALRLWNYSMMLSDTLLHAYQRAIRDMRLLGDGMQVELLPQGEYFAMHFGATSGGCPDGFSFDAALGGFVVFSRWLIKDQGFAPQRVEFTHEPPADSAPYQALFGCAVHFAQPENRLLIAHSDLQRPVPTGDKALVSLYDRYIGAQAPLGESALVARVRQMVAELLPQGEPMLERVADALNMSARTLRRRLQQDGTGFRELLDKLRQELCAQYLVEGRATQKEIAYRLGYTEPSSFHRAFKRWYGVSPGEYRSIAAIGGGEGNSASGDFP